jgi:hypothetical protein
VTCNIIIPYPVKLILKKVRKNCVRDPAAKIPKVILSEYSFIFPKKAIKLI